MFSVDQISHWVNYSDPLEKEIFQQLVNNEEKEDLVYSCGNILVQFHKCELEENSNGKLYVVNHYWKDFVSCDLSKPPSLLFRIFRKLSLNILLPYILREYGLDVEKYSKLAKESTRHYVEISNGLKAAAFFVYLKETELVD
jgi:hypothetical protein